MPPDLSYDTSATKMESHQAKPRKLIPGQGRTTTAFEQSDHRQARQVSGAQKKRNQETQTRKTILFIFKGP